MSIKQPQKSNSSEDFRGKAQNKQKTVNKSGAKAATKERTQPASNRNKQVRNTNKKKLQIPQQNQQKQKVDALQAPKKARPVSLKKQNKPRNNQRKKDMTNQKRKTPIRIIPLGGLNEVGKNLTCFECGNDMIIVDCGLAFPDPEMLGVDLVIPDYTYVEKNKHKLRGIVLTHGHEDHIGGLPYFLKSIKAPIYGTKLTIGLVEGKLKEHGLLRDASLNVVTHRQIIKLGCMAVEFIRVNHSIPDAMGLALHTPAGVIVHTGDFKIDYTPIEGGVIDLARFGELGNKGVLALMSDSTNAERAGTSMTERKVGETFKSLFRRGEGKRIIIASFSSNIHRVQQMVDMAVMHGRKIAVSGRSMVNVVGKAIELGYLKVPEGILIDMKAVGRYSPEQIVIVTTGSQGEPMSALTRMAMNDHRQVTITPEDMIIISATPIPGNEKYVGRVVNGLLKLGADVIYESMYEVHVSGHACQDELKLMLSITKPKFFIPVHGEYKHLIKHASLATEMGMPRENILLGDNGQVIELDGVEMKVVNQVPAGRVLVDGLGVGDVGSIVLRDRKHLAEDGLIIVVATMDNNTGKVVAGPDIVSRGFVYVRESEELMVKARQVLRRVLDECADKNIREWGLIKQKMREALSEFIYTKTKRRPMILPVIMEI